MASFSVNPLMWLCLSAHILRAVGDANRSLTPALRSPFPNWHGIIYQIYPRSFYDSDGDGTGDLPGITAKLAYLRETGVSVVWISPFQPSPMVDFGYDITDFCAVDARFGTLADFDRLLVEAHTQRLIVVLDFVPNHTSDQHRWFRWSAERRPGYEDYYVWRDGTVNGTTGERRPPNNWVAVFNGPAWHWNAVRGQWYFHQFTRAQPDLNLRNAAVVREMEEVLAFWLRRGVNGFRVDAASFLFEDERMPDERRSGQLDNPVLFDYVQHRFSMHRVRVLQTIHFSQIIYLRQMCNNLNLSLLWKLIPNEIVRSPSAWT